MTAKGCCLCCQTHRRTGRDTRAVKKTSQERQQGWLSMFTCLQPPEPHQCHRAGQKYLSDLDNRRNTGRPRSSSFEPQRHVSLPWPGCRNDICKRQCAVMAQSTGSGGRQIRVSPGSSPSKLRDSGQVTEPLQASVFSCVK